MFLSALTSILTGRNQELTGGWYYAETKDFNPVSNSLQTKFSSIFRKEHYITPSKYLSYISDEQITALKQEFPLKFTRYPKKTLNFLNSNKNNKFTVIADDTWQPNAKCQKIKFEYFECNSLTQNEIDSIINQSIVREIQSSKQAKLQARYAVGYIESGKDYLSDYNGYFEVPRVLSDLGIDGSNQIITIQDNGVDLHHS